MPEWTRQGRDRGHLPMGQDRIGAAHRQATCMPETHGACHGSVMHFLHQTRLST